MLCNGNDIVENKIQSGGNMSNTLEPLIPRGDNFVQYIY